MLTLAPFDLTVAENDGAVSLSVVGELDCASAPRLRQALSELVGRYRLVVLDMSGIEFADCAGIDPLVAAHERQRRQRGDLVVRSPSEAVRRVLELTGVDDQIRVV